MCRSPWGLESDKSQAIVGVKKPFHITFSFCFPFRFFFQDYSTYHSIDDEDERVPFFTRARSSFFLTHISWTTVAVGSGRISG